jgi:hypothetical protein
MAEGQLPPRAPAGVKYQRSPEAPASGRRVRAARPPKAKPITVSASFGPERPTAIRSDHRRQALAEDAAVTSLIRAAELARRQSQADGNACPRQIAQSPLIATVKSGRGTRASGAVSMGLSGLHHDSNQVCLRDNLFQSECRGISRERLHPLSYTSRLPFHQKCVRTGQWGTP